MGQELTQANETLLEFERLIQTGGCNAWEGVLRTGWIWVPPTLCWRWWMNRTGRWPGPLIPSTVVRDGIVVDYMGGGSGGHTSERTVGGAPGRHAGRRSLRHSARHP